MKKILRRALLTVGVMGLAYYLNDPKKYHRMAGSAKKATGDALKKGQQALS